MSQYKSDKHTSDVFKRVLNTLLAIHLLNLGPDVRAGSEINHVNGLN